MRLKVDQDADALYLALGEGVVARSEEVAPGILVDYDDLDRVLGIEMLSISRRSPQVDLRSLLFEILPRVA